VVNGGLHAGKGLGGTAGGFDFKSVEFENSFEGQQDGEIVVDQKNAAFHVRLLQLELEMQRAASTRSDLHQAITEASQINGKTWVARRGRPQRLKPRPFKTQSTEFFSRRFSRSIHSFSIGAWLAST
jgi:hypothetical protein